MEVEEAVYLVFCMCKVNIKCKFQMNSRTVLFNCLHTYAYYWIIERVIIEPSERFVVILKPTLNILIPRKYRLSVLGRCSQFYRTKFSVHKRVIYFGKLSSCFACLWSHFIIVRPAICTYFFRSKNHTDIIGFNSVRMHVKALIILTYIQNVFSTENICICMYVQRIRWAVTRHGNENICIISEISFYTFYFGCMWNKIIIRNRKENCLGK